MQSKSFVIVLAVSAATLLASSHAHAQAADVAKKLLAEAKKQREAGNIPAACSLLDRAYEMDAKDGILFARADCRDLEGKIVAATNLYEAYMRAYSRMTGASKQAHAERAATAKARLETLGPQVPMVKFVWDKPPPEGTNIIVDGVEFSASTLDVKLPLEPGTHDIIVKLPGEPERSRTVTLAKGGSTIIDLTPLSPEALEKLKQANKPLEPLKGPGTGATVKKKQSTDPVKIAGFVGAGLGVAGIIAGGVTGGLAISEKKIVDERCNGDRKCDPIGLAAAKRFQSIGNISTATFIAGGVLAGVGATLLVVAYKPAAGSTATARVKANVSPMGTYLGVEGSF